jgi:hypothetical protein
MAAKKKAANARKAAEGAWGNPYVQRVIEDAELRDNVRAAYDSARKAYGRLSNGKPATKQLMDDKKLHKELKNAAESLRDAGDALRGKRKRRGGGLGRLLLLAIVGAGLALALNEDLRNKALDALFGAEEEFDYTSNNASSGASSPATAATGS